MEFCTLFNASYSYKGWVMFYTLLKQSPQATLYVLCMDDTVFNEGVKLGLDNLKLIRLKDLEKMFPSIAATKRTRQFREYIVSLKPFLPSYIFRTYGSKKVFFIDSDVVFLNDPKLIDESMSDHSIYVYDLDLDKPRGSGPITSGFMAFADDENSEVFLKWWQDRCVEWCKWYAAPNKKFAEQGYLNVFYDNPTKFKNYVVYGDPGIHIGPWNIKRHNLQKLNGQLVIDKTHILVCYHFHEFKLVGNSYSPTGWPLDKKHIDWIYKPYFSLIQKYSRGELWKKI